MAPFCARMKTTVPGAIPAVLWCRCFVFLLLQFAAINAFSASQPSSQQQQQPQPEAIQHSFIEFVDLIAATTTTATSSSGVLSTSNNRLPVSWTQEWSTWVLETTSSSLVSSSALEATGHGKRLFVKIPDTNGFVPPSSVDTLFQPVDLKAPTMSLAIGVHIRNGMIRHVLPAVDICYEQGSHRNRGLCSVPRAYQWIDYSHGLAFWLQNLELRAWKRKMVKRTTSINNDDDDDDDDGKDETDGEDEDREDEGWIELASLTSGGAIVQAIEQVQYALADNPPAELGEGSHILHVLLERNTNDDCDSSQGNYRLEYPKTGYELCIILEEKRDETNFLIDRRMQRLPSPDGNAYGILHVGVSAAMAGSESEYLPDAYRPLYEDPTLRNPIYERFRERRRQASGGK